MNFTLPSAMCWSYYIYFFSFMFLKICKQYKCKQVASGFIKEVKH